jgi:hypothetical protein
VLREKNEYNISKIYTKLTWLDFGRLEPREDMETCRGKLSSLSTTAAVRLYTPVLRKQNVNKMNTVNTHLISESLRSVKQVGGGICSANGIRVSFEEM